MFNSLLLHSNSILGIGISHRSHLVESSTLLETLGSTSPCDIKKPIVSLGDFCKNFGIPNLSIAPQIPYPLKKFTLNSFGISDPNGIKKLPAPERVEELFFLCEKLS